MRSGGFDTFFTDVVNTRVKNTQPPCEEKGKGKYVYNTNNDGASCAGANCIYSFWGGGAIRLT